MSFPDFVWAVGEESSDPIVIDGTGGTVRVDELAASEHLLRQREDLADIADLGVRVIRYGMPWRCVEPEPGRYDWNLWDVSLNECDALGLEPIVDLCHFGLPDHLGGFAHLEWVDAFLRYFESFCERYPKVRWVTPVNEPTTTATMSGQFGVWNDRLASEEAHARIISLCTLANLEAHSRLVADRNGWTIGAEALTVPFGDVQDAATKRRLAFANVAWDLQFGFDIDPVIRSAFDPVPTAVLDRIGHLACTGNHVAGHDLYPISVIDMPEDVERIVDAYENWATSWHERYGFAFWVAETSNLGLGVDRQSEWLEALSGRIVSMRERGLPAKGICWYSRGDQFDWQTALIAPTGTVTEVGLFDRQRRPRPAAATFKRLVESTPASGR